MIKKLLSAFKHFILLLVAAIEEPEYLTRLITYNAIPTYIDRLPNGKLVFYFED